MMQLELFKTQTKKRPKKQSQKQQLENLANEAIAYCLNQKIAPEELIAELQFRELCETLDAWPVRLRKQFVVKLLKRYVNGHNATPK